MGHSTVEPRSNPDRDWRSLTRRSFIGRSAGAALAVGGVGSFLAACGGGSSGEEGGEVVVLSWAGGYIGPEIAQALKDEANITLKPVPGESDQDMFTKVKAGGGSQYDIVFANCGWSPTYYDNDLIEPIDLNEIAGSDQLWPIFREDTSFPYILNPNEVLLFPNMWDTLAMIWNTTVSYQPSKPYSWNQLWDPEIEESKVLFHGAPDDVLATAGLALGVPPEEIYAMAGSELEAVVDYLIELKPFQLSKSDQITIESIKSAKAWIGLCPSIAMAAQTNEEAGETVAANAVPKEGTLGWVDGPQLVRDAKNRDNALKFMEIWNTDEEFQDFLFAEYGYAQCNEESTDRTLSAGGEEAKLVRQRAGDDPEQAKQLLFQGPPDDPQAWTEAYDQVVGA